MKKALCVILLCVTALSLMPQGILPITGHADTLGALSYEISEGEAIIKHCDTAVTEVVIPQAIEGYPVTKISEWAFSNCESLAYLEIPDGVTTISSFAFFGCKALESLILPKSVTSIAYGAFVSLKNAPTLTENPVYHNAGGSVIHTADKTLVYAASNYELPNDGSVKRIGSYAYACSQVESVAIPEGITSIGSYAFMDCVRLLDVTLPSSLESIGEYAFTRCSSLGKISLPNSLTELGSGAFKGCAALTEAELTNSILHINSYTFSQCSSLESITLPDKLLSIGYRAFIGCESLEALEIPATTISIEEFSLPANASISVAEENAFFVSVNDCLIVTHTRSLLHGNRRSVIPADGSVTAISSYAFSDSDITEIVLPDTITKIGHSAFRWCESLTSIRLPDPVSAIEGFCFEGCTALKRVIMPKSLKLISSYAFSECSDLKTVEMPANPITIEMLAFNLCPSLDTVYFLGNEIAHALITFTPYGNFSLMNAEWKYHSSKQHIYSDASDPSCNECGALRSLARSGDFDEDGEITVSDALSVLRVTLDFTEAPESIDIADIDGDGALTVSDALLILRKAAGLI